LSRKKLSPPKKKSRFEDVVLEIPVAGETKFILGLDNAKESEVRRDTIEFS